MTALSRRCSSSKCPPLAWVAKVARCSATEAASHLSGVLRKFDPVLGHPTSDPVDELRPIANVPGANSMQRLQALLNCRSFTRQSFDLSEAVLPFDRYGPDAIA